MQQIDDSAQKYSIKHPKGLFLLAISKKAERFVVGTIVWYEKTGKWELDTLRTDWHLKHFIEMTHDEVYDQAVEWLNTHLGAPISIDRA